MSTTTSLQDDRAITRSATRTGPADATRQFDLSGRVVLLATDGSEDAMAAAHVAQALARMHKADIHAVSVVDTRGAPIPPPLDVAFGMADAIVGEAVHDQQAAEVREKLSSALDTRITWPVRVTHGTPSPAIAREATRVDAALIVVGLRRHGTIDRAMHDETTLNLMKAVTCPVLAVVPGTTTLPQRVLAALDFSSASIRATQVAAAIAAPGARFTLAYVPSFGYADPHEGEALIHQLGVGAAFSLVASGICRDDLQLDHVVLHHTQPTSPAKLLLEHADAMHFDLISAGSARHSRLEQWIMGSVSTELVRDGRHSLLVIPRTADLKTIPKD